MAHRWICPLAAVVVAVSATLFPKQAPQEEKDEGNAPRLLLFLVIDQARADYLSRFADAFEGGLKRLVDEGIVFRQAYHHHAITNTAPGHAALISGRYPGPAGIVSNEWYDRRLSRRVYCVEDPASPLLPPDPGASLGNGRSPRNLEATTLSDWIKVQRPGSKVFAASRKDRSAIILGGHLADGAFWIEPWSAEWITSRYYMPAYPPWAAEFRTRRFPDRQFGQPWAPLPNSQRHYPQMQVHPLDRGAMTPRFPHYLGEDTPEPTPDFYGDYSDSPFADAYLTEFAKTLIEREELGADEVIDFLGLSYSATDYIGHRFGPHSPELFDTLLRLDRTLGDLLSFIDGKVGLKYTLVVLSSDHGVVTLPETHPQAQGAKRSGAEEVLCVQQTAKHLEERFGPGPWFHRGLPYLDYRRLGELNLRRQEVEKAAAEWIEDCPSVAKVWTRTELESEGPWSDDLEIRRASFHPQRSPDLQIQFRRNHLARLSDGTSHGTPYDYDAHVPLILRLPNGTGATIEPRLRTVDLAPTLARLLELQPPGDLDGHDRFGWLPKP